MVMHVRWCGINATKVPIWQIYCLMRDNARSPAMFMLPCIYVKTFRAVRN